MSAHAGPSSSQSLTIRDIRNIFRVVGSYVDANPELMRKEGVFRISAPASDLPGLTSDILSGKPLDNKHDIHKYIGVLKSALGQNILIEADNESVRKLKDALNGIKSSDRETVRVAQESIHQFIQELNQSNDPDQLDLAEILHTYIHLNTIALKYADENKMQASNLAIASTGPFFLNNLPVSSQDSDPFRVVVQMGQFNEAAEAAIQSAQYDEPYAIAFVGENVEARKAQLQILEKQQDALQRIFERQKQMIDEHARAIMADQQKMRGYIEMLATHDAAYKQRKIKKDDYKKLSEPVKSQIALLQEEMRKLELSNMDLLTMLKREQKQRQQIQEQLSDLSSAISAWEQRKSPDVSPDTSLSSPSTSREGSPSRHDSSSPELASSSPEISSRQRSRSVVFSQSSSFSEDSPLPSSTQLKEETKKSSRKHRQ